MADSGDTGDRFQRWAKKAADTPESETPRMIPAATVIVVRDTPGGLETLMLRRNSKLEFAGGMWVFPGGRIDDGDHGGTDDDHLAPARRAAVREAKEEAGLDVVEAGLVPFSHWEPPPITPKRFSTWFFLGTAADTPVEIDDGEIKDHAWLRPADALARRDALEIELAPPTWVTLFELAAHDQVGDAVAAAGRRDPEHFVTNIAMVDDGVVALWHGDAGYDDGDAQRSGPRHRLNMVRTGWSYERDG